MKTNTLLIVTGALLLLASAPLVHSADNLEIDPGTGPAQLTLKGPAAAAAGDSGFVITHVDDGGADGLSAPISVGKFLLRRPIGFYQWNFTEADATTPRPALELNDDHSLLLRSSDAADRAATPELNAVELRPGANGGVFFNGVPLVSSAGTNLSTTLTVGGGQLAYGDFPMPYYWAGQSTPPGLMAVGDDARAFGDQAVAVGYHARAGFHSTALGNATYAQNHSAVLGWNSTALNMATAIGNSAFASGAGSVAMGSNAYASGEYTTAVGSSAAATASYAAGLGGWANGVGSCGAAWGTTWGEASISLGGYTGAYKSFAADSGVTWGKYSVALGRGTVTTQDYQVVLGTFNPFARRWLPNNDPDTALQSSDPIFVIGNGHAENDGLPNYAEVRSNAFTVGYDGATWLQGGLTVEGGSVQAPATSVFKRDVSVRGVLRVPESGDLSMGGFTAGTPP
jgi:hypothetical protein